MNSSIEQKKALVADLVAKMKDSKAVVAFKYQGLTVEKFQQLRRSMRANGCDVAIIKNNITRRAASELGYQEFADLLSGPIAIAFASEDMVAPAKEIYAFAKDNKCVEVVSGVVDGTIYSVNQLEELEHSYCITIHKAQGSEFDVIIMVIPQAAPMLLTRNLLYTGITRAKKMLIIIGNERVINYMIDNVDSKKRNTGLEYKLKNN